jgi:transposase
LPLDFHLTGAEASDSRQFETLLDLDPEVTPRAVIADKGYDAKANRQAARARGSVPVIPYRSNVKNLPKFFPKKLYALRARIEILRQGKTLQALRLALREDGAQLRYNRRACLRIYLGPIRPHGLGTRFLVTALVSDAVRPLKGQKQGA